MRLRKALWVLCALSLAALLATSASAQQAAVATADPHATEAAIAVLERGGNAVDAATAVAFVLAVTMPDAGNIGGGGFMTLFMDGRPEFLDYRETAPAAADRDMYLDDNGVPVVDASLTGLRAAGTPGTVAGLWAAHQRHGSLPWDSLLQPAIMLAEDGFEMPRWLADLIAAERSRLGRTNFHAHYGRAAAGERFRQPELARTLRAIARQGRDGFYRGPVAELLVAQMQAGDGLISAGDLADYQPRWREPLVAPWREFTLLTAPLPSSGGFAIVQYLKIRDLLGDAFLALPHNSPQYIHIKSEIEKRIFADRGQYLGDPDFIDVDFDHLLSDDYLQKRAAEINLERPTETVAVRAGLESRHTTHFSILDNDGNAVSNTYTLNTDFGSGVVVEGAGFLLNNEMDDFSVAPGQPNYYGVVGDEANAIEPGKRMLSSMSPSILLRDDEVAMVLGAMGGSTIFTTVYQMISNIIDYRMSPDDAQAATRVHHQLLPEDLITYSPGTPLPAQTIDTLRERGYRVQPHDWEFGNVQLIWVSDDGRYDASSDPRFHGRAALLR